MSHLVYRVALWDYLGENLYFNMDRIVIKREENLKSAILIFWSIVHKYLSLTYFKRFPVLSFLYVFHS